MADHDPSAPARGNPDEHAFYRAESSRLRRFFRGRLGRSEEVNDLVQEAFARLAGRSSGEGLINPAAYLNRIARNLLFDRARRGAARPEVVDIDGEDCPELPVQPEQGHALEAQETMEAYERAVEALPPRTRQVFLLQRLAGLSYAEIADRLDISVRTVEWHMAEALLRIRRALGGE